MLRIPIEPRLDWQQEVESWGMVYHTHEDRPYWNESAYYALDDHDVELIESATNELHGMCLQAVKRCISEDRLKELNLPERAMGVIEASWMADAPSLYGRFDLAYDGHSPPKLLEYNADTPTALLEAAVVQWQWSQSRFPGSDQFNSIWESLVARWKGIAASLGLKTFHFGHDESLEDLMTVSLLRDTAEEAGLATTGIHMSEIGWSEKSNSFVDLEDRPIKSLFKLYPWEWMVEDEFGQHALDHYLRIVWLEPIWKLALSSKAILAVLWDMFPGHPNLLPAYVGSPNGLTSFAKKPIYSREGGNVALIDDGTLLEETGGEYGAEGFVYQGLANLIEFDGVKPIIGSWVVGAESCGVGIRETDGWITTDLARFVPHVIQAPSH